MTTFSTLKILLLTSSKMLDLAVEQAAGVINVAVLVDRSAWFRQKMISPDKQFVAQLTLPLAVVCVLAGMLKESNNTVT